MAIRIQIYTAQSVAEATEVAALGVDHVGVTPSDAGLPGEVGAETAAGICDALRGVAASVALSVATDAEEIVTMVEAVRPDILHLCGPPGALGPDRVAALRLRVPQVAVMQAIAVTGPDAIDVARSFRFVVDYLILDTHDPAIPGIGAAGTVHDWDVSAAIVAEAGIPVILAGGLSPDNVVAAVARVRPWGVDSLTHTNRVLPGGGFVKDLDRVAAFVAAARGGAAP